MCDNDDRVPREWREHVSIRRYGHSYVVCGLNVVCERYSLMASLPLVIRKNNVSRAMLIVVG